jgi:hypothetical protein
MYNAQLSNPKTTYSDILHSVRQYSYPDQEVWHDVNLVGHDFKKLIFNTTQQLDIMVFATECRKACKNVPKCQAWVFHAGACWMKDMIPTPSPEKGAISGILSDNYKCNN